MSWLSWYIGTLSCKHAEGPWRMKDFGMGQVKRCIHCGKVLRLR